MSTKPPSWFNNPTAKGEGKDEQRRRKQIEEQLPRLLEERERKDRAHSFYPHLLVRSVLGDRGDRPFNVPFWESPDIWTAPGDPASSKDVPASHGGTVQAGVANTIYAHVWNLGFAPLAGVRIEFYWCNPSLAIDGAHAHLVGVARCELAGRGQAGSHKLVKCPTPWVPVVENGGHECLMVRVSGVGDPIGNNEWHPWLNRHVAQRNISVIAAGTTTERLVTSLNETRRRDAHLELIQVGPREGAMAARLVAPKLKVATLDTHLLGELTVTNEIVLGRPLRPSAGMFAPVHLLAREMDIAPPRLRTLATVTPVIHPSLLLPDLMPTRPAPTVATPTSTRVADLLGAVGPLHRGVALGQPKAREAFVLRMASYVGEQLVGGYTLVVGKAK